jgi:hypothetical protein
MTVRERLVNWNRHRRFSTQRAGKWSESEGRRRREDYIQHNWKTLVFEVLAVVASSALVLLVPRWCRQFVGGAWIASFGWLIWLQIVVQSGSATRDMGALAEQWTAHEMYILRRRGWRIMNHLSFAEGDIDHVAIGPGGILVVETKWRSDELGLGEKLQWLDFSGLRQNAREVRLWLKEHLGDAPARQVVVLWGPVARRNEVLEHAPDDITVIPGRLFAAWLKSIPATGVTPDQVASAWDKMEPYVTTHDRWEIEKFGPEPRSIGSRLFETALAVLTGLVGFTASAFSLRWVHVPWFWAVVAVLVGVGIVARRVSRLRLLAVGWLAGTSFFALVIVGAYAYEALRRL